MSLAWGRAGFEDYFIFDGVYAELFWYFSK